VCTIGKGKWLPASKTEAVEQNESAEKGDRFEMGTGTIRAHSTPLLEASDKSSVSEMGPVPKGSSPLPDPPLPEFQDIDWDWLDNAPPLFLDADAWTEWCLDPPPLVAAAEGKASEETETESSALRTSPVFVMPPPLPGYATAGYARPDVTWATLPSGPWCFGDVSSALPIYGATSGAAATPPSYGGGAPPSFQPAPIEALIDDPPTPLFDERDTPTPLFDELE